MNNSGAQENPHGGRSTFRLRFRSAGYATTGALAGWGASAAVHDSDGLAELAIGGLGAAGGAAVGLTYFHGTSKLFALVFVLGAALVGMPGIWLSNSSTPDAQSNATGPTNQDPSPLDVDREEGLAPSSSQDPLNPATMCLGASRPTPMRVRFEAGTDFVEVPVDLTSGAVSFVLLVLGGQVIELSVALESDAESFLCVDGRSRTFSRSSAMTAATPEMPFLTGPVPHTQDYVISLVPTTADSTAVLRIVIRAPTASG